MGRGARPADRCHIGRRERAPRHCTDAHARTAIAVADWFGTSQQVWVTFGAVGLAIALVVTAFDPRRWRSAALLGLSVGLIAAVSWIPDGGWQQLVTAQPSLSRVGLELSGSLRDLARWNLGDWANGADGPLNVLLYAPAGIVAGWRARRGAGGGAFVLLALLSVATEAYQACTGTRAGSVADVLSNSAGALAGVTAGVLARRHGRTAAAGSRARPVSA